MLRTFIRCRATQLAAVAMLGLSLFGGSSAQAAQIESSYIFGGRPSASCEWPNVGRVGGCTATLMSDSVIVFAAHCGANHRYVTFEEGKRKIRLKHCEVNPKFNQGALGEGVDWAYCELADTSWSKNVPLVPPLRKKELAQIKAPYPATLVGYGRNDFGMEAGKLGEVDAEVTSLSREAAIGGEGADSCQGDSGGPAFVQVADGSWRALGITSYGGACGQGGYYSLFAHAIPWIEARTGKKIANCEKGKKFGCEALMLDPGGDYGREDGMCNAGPLLESNQVPRLHWLGPGAGHRYEASEGVNAILAVTESERLPRAQLVIELDGKFHSQHDAGVNTLALRLPSMSPGQHVLRAKIKDEDGEIRNVARLAFRWDLPDETVDAQGSDIDGDEPSVKEGPRPAGCSLAGDAKGSTLWALALLGLMRASRRRNAAGPC